MTERQRIITVFNGKTPDRAPFMLDLSHYYFEKFQKEWNITGGHYAKPDIELIEYHRKFDVGFYLPNQSLQYTTHYSENVQITTSTELVNNVPQITWKYETPIGIIIRSRIWEPSSYSWAINKWGVTTEQDLKVLAYALSSRTYEPYITDYNEWKEAVGDLGIVYLLPGYSAMGYILSYWMGIENTMYAVVDWNSTMHEVVEQINTNNLELIKILAEYPDAPGILMGDNFSSDIQPPSFFNEWSADYYKKAISIIHKGGKKTAVHVDGRLRNAIGMIRDCGADIIDAVTPTPMGDLSPQQCRDEAGDSLILSGGVSPDLWLPSVPMDRFRQAVMDWLEIRKRSSALIANAGDQVPPKAEECRIEVMRELVEKYGQY